MTTLPATGAAPTGDASNLKAILFALASTAVFSVIFASGRFAGDLASPIQIIFLRYLGGLLTVVVIAAARRRSLTSLRSQRQTWHFIRIIGGAFGGIAIVYSNANMPLVDANAISQLSTIFLVAMGMVFLGERLSIGHFLAIAVCISGAGTIIASRGAFADFRPEYLLPACVALVGAGLFALEAFFIKLLTRVDDPLRTLVYANVLGTLLLLVPALATWQSAGPENFVFLAFGPLAIMAQYCTLRSYTLADITIVAPVKYAALVFAGLIGWVFFVEVPTPGAIMGALLIAAGGVGLARLQRRVIPPVGS